MHIPRGFNTVTPYFFVKDAEKFCEFLTQGLGGEEVLRSMRDGMIVNAQIRLGTSTLMVSEAVAAYPPMSAAYYLYVENADQSMEQAMQHGATLEMAVADMPYGDRQGGVRDACGNIWWISQRLTDAPYT